eukprot:5332373-Pyramimonas_sp.AAC.1
MGHHVGCGSPQRRQCSAGLEGMNPPWPAPGAAPPLDPAARVREGHSEGVGGHPELQLHAATLRHGAPQPR